MANDNVKNEAEDIKKSLRDIAERVKRLNRDVEGNARDASDWLACARVKTFDAVAENDITLSRTQLRTVLSKEFKTGGGKLYGFIMVDGDAIDGVAEVYIKVDGSLINPMIVFDVKGEFSKTFISFGEMAKGIHRLDVDARASTGTVNIKSQGTRMVLFVPGEKF